MRNPVFRLAVGAALLLSPCLPATARSQINAENFARLGFNFSPPGARATALGGAFVALADDATAAEANPAGLTVLLYPQVSVEAKGVEYKRTMAPEAGGGPTGMDFFDQVGQLSFASVVLPLGRARLAAFRHELVNYRNRAYSRGAQLPSGGYLYPYTADLDMQVQNYGGALALRISPAFSIGLAGGVSLLDMTVDFTRYQVARYERGYEANHLLVEGDEASASGRFINAGVLLRIGEVASIGAVYKLRPEFEDLTYRFVDVAGVATEAPDTFTVKVPDAIGAGVALRPHPLLTVSLAAEQVRYSQLADSIAIAYSSSGTEATAAEFTADDGVDLHAGLEYVLLVGRTPIGLRAGISRLAPSNTYYLGSKDVERRLWGTEAGETATYFTGGLGAVLLGKLQLDVAALRGSERSELVASLVYFFGRT